VSADVSLGVVGCGAIARAVHLRLLPRLAGVRVVALADPDRARLAEAIPMAPGAGTFESAQELLERAPVDGIVVCSPTAQHARDATLALAAGRHVYVEKPIAASLEQGRQVVDGWRRSGLVGMVGFNGRFNPLLAQLGSLLREDRAGKIVCVRTTFTTAPRPVPEWKQSRATGGGVLLDLASHHIDFVRALFEREVVNVRASLDSRRTEDDTAYLELQLAGGLRVQAFFSLAAAERELIEICGERAVLSVSRFTSIDVDVRDNPNGLGGALARLARRALAIRFTGRALAIRRSPLREPGYRAALERFVSAIRTHRSTGSAPVTPPDLGDGLACLAVIDAAERSAQSGATVAMPGTR
jgi:predicted dehydrogenase